MELTLEKVTSPEEKIKVDDFIHEHFVPDMPLVRAFGVGHYPPPRPSAVMSGAEDFYIKAMDSQGCTVGVAVNKVNPRIQMDPNISPQVRELVELLKFAEDEAGVNQLSLRMIELRILSVAKEWRQRGVARRLAEESMRLAKEAGFEAMSVCCTSEFTARIVRRLGWREHYRLSYKEYPKLSGAEVHMIPVPGHDYLYYYVTQL